jgi:hypothetical protein
LLMCATGLMRCAPAFKGRTNVMGPHVSSSWVEVNRVILLGIILLWQANLLLWHEHFRR